MWRPGNYFLQNHTEGSAFPTLVVVCQLTTSPCEVTLTWYATISPYQLKNELSEIQTYKLT